jgi:hypothetical protein
MKAALVAVVSVVAAVAVGCGGSGLHVVGEPHVKAVPKGHLLAGQVLVVELPSGEFRICGNQASDLMFGPPACPGGPLAVGIRADELQGHSSKPHERWGYLYLMGSYRDGTFRVISQSRRGPSNQPTGSSFGEPPCAAPPGGWLLRPRTDAQQNSIDHYSKLAGHHDLVGIAFFDHGSVLTVASSDPARTRAVLGKHWPRQLCVVKARYSRALLIHEEAKMVALLKQPGSPAAAAYGWPSGGGGTTVNYRGQPMTTLEVLLVTRKLRAYLREQPPGIIQVQATLRPFGYA